MEILPVVWSDGLPKCCKKRSDRKTIVAVAASVKWKVHECTSADRT